MSRNARRSGFTLLETVIAMSLLTLLLAVLWSIFGMFTKYDEKGKRAAAKSALVRSLHRQIREDLIAAIGVNDRLPQSDSSRSENQEEPWQPQNGYFVGSASQMHFVAYVARDGEPLTRRESDFISVGSSSTPTELFRVISYEPRSEGEAESSEFDATSPDIADSLLLDLDVAVDETPIGIDRHVRNWQQYIESRSLIDEQLESTFAGRDIVLDRDDFLEIGATDDSPETAAEMSKRRAPLVDEIPEIRAMFFRYFDGTTWASSWDSSQNGRLPIAIEIGFDLDMTDPEPPSDSDSTEELDSDPLEDADDIRTEIEETIANADTIDLNQDSDFTLEPTWTTEFRWVIALDSILPSRESLDELPPESLGETLEGSFNAAGSLP